MIIQSKWGQLEFDLPTSKSGRVVWEKATNVKVNWWVQKKVWKGWVGAIMGVITVVACVVAAIYCPYAIPWIIAAAGAISTIFKIPNMVIDFIVHVVSEALGILVDVFGEFLGTLIAIVIVIVITYLYSVIR